MYVGNYRDLVGGASLIAAGLTVALFSLSSYDVGTVTRMGPGMFPAALGFLLAGLGVIVLITALFQSGTFPTIDLRAALAVLTGIGAFALVIGPFGLAPAILAVVLVSSAAERKFRPLSLTVLCGALCVMAYLIFGAGLGLPIPMIKGLS